MGSKITKIFTYIITISGVIASFILGSVLKIVEKHYYGAKTHYNFYVLLYGLIATAITTTIFVLVYYHFKNQETLIEKNNTTNNILHKIETSIKNENKETVHNENPSNEKPKKYDMVTHKWRCDKCYNLISSYPCPHCGFEK